MKRHNIQKYIPALEKMSDKRIIILQYTGALHLVPLIDHLASSLTAKIGETIFYVPKIH